MWLEKRCQAFPKARTTFPINPVDFCPSERLYFLNEGFQFAPKKQRSLLVPQKDFS